MRKRNKMDITVLTMMIKVDLATETPAFFMNISWAIPPPPWPRGQKGQKIVAEDNIEHVLIVHLFIRKMSQRNKSCPVKEKTYTEKEKGQQGVLRTKCRQIIQGPAIKG